MKVIILAGGFGTRLSELTELIPKPMVPIGGRPILWHIMNHYAYYGHNDFYIALGYKADVIKEYFLNYHSLNSDFRINLETAQIDILDRAVNNWKVTLIDTGLNSMTGGRIKRMKGYLPKESVMLTYGDGLSDIDINQLIQFHESHGKMVTISSVRPSARFGELVINGESVTCFQEKPQINQGWINGGFMVVNPEFFDLIEGDSTVLEREPLERLAQMGELMAYRHEGFWQCMDTKRDRDLLEELWVSGNAPWAERRMN
jgi:glucose-1-phosphate cytidylyltransferase